MKAYRRTRAPISARRPRPYPAALTLIVATAVALTACVSVNLGPKKGQRSDNVAYKAPAAPFVAIDARGADSAWQNAANGNTISYHSVCNDPTDPSLEDIQKELISALEEARVLRSASTRHDGREALSSETEGLVDGVATRLETLVFKKNNCIYTLTYVGVAKSFPDDLERFQEFLKSFEAP